jgi:membrane protease YdiL (CAAX protease family)
MDGRARATSDVGVLGHEQAPPAAVVVPVATLVARGAAYGWSRFTAAFGTALPVGTLSLVAAVVLTVRAPGRFGWRWADSGRRWRIVATALATVVVAVSVFRLLSPPAPYALSVAEVTVVPLGEEGLFRGFAFVALLTLFRRLLEAGTATRVAVLSTSLAFAVGHLGNLGSVPAGFVFFQVGVGVGFGVLAGWVRACTDSLVGPVLLHAVMNGLAVA